MVALEFAVIVDMICKIWSFIYMVIFAGLFSVISGILLREKKHKGICLMDMKLKLLVYIVEVVVTAEDMMEKDMAMFKN